MTTDSNCQLQKRQGHPQCGANHVSWSSDISCLIIFLQHPEPSRYSALNTPGSSDKMRVSSVPSASPMDLVVHPVTALSQSPWLLTFYISSGNLNSDLHTFKVNTLLSHVPHP